MAVREFTISNNSSRSPGLRGALHTALLTFLMVPQHRPHFTDKKRKLNRETQNPQSYLAFSVVQPHHTCSTFHPFLGLVEEGADWLRLPQENSTKTHGSPGKPIRLSKEVPWPHKPPTNTSHPGKLEGRLGKSLSLRRKTEVSDLFDLDTTGF